MSTVTTYRLKFRAPYALMGKIPSSQDLKYQFLCCGTNRCNGIWTTYFILLVSLFHSYYQIPNKFYCFWSVRPGSRRHKSVGDPFSLVNLSPKIHWAVAAQYAEVNLRSKYLLSFPICPRMFQCWMLEVLLPPPFIALVESRRVSRCTCHWDIPIPSSMNVSLWGCRIGSCAQHKLSTRKAGPYAWYLLVLKGETGRKTAIEMVRKREGSSSKTPSPVLEKAEHFPVVFVVQGAPLKWRRIHKTLVRNSYSFIGFGINYERM